MCDSWTGFTNFTLLKRNFFQDTCGPGGACRRFKQLPDLIVCLSKAARNQEKQELEIEKPKLDKSRKLRGIYFINPEDEVFLYFRKSDICSREMDVQKTKVSVSQLYGIRECLGQCASAHNLHAMECLRERNEPLVLRELVRFGPSIQPHGEFLFLLMQKKPAFVPPSTLSSGWLLTAIRQTTLAMRRCMSLDCMDLVKNLSLLARLGGGKGSPELPYGIGHAVPRIVSLVFERACRLSDKPL